jgi:hypothetical protein
MSMGQGDRLGEALAGMKATCLRCKRPIVFANGVGVARRRGIQTNVVACEKCGAVYKVDMSPRGMSLTTDVTTDYPLDKYPDPGPPVDRTSGVYKLGRMIGKLFGRR